MHWNDLTTPAALVHADRLEANTARIAKRVQEMGARLRPHVKTHKCVEAARLQVRGHFGGITVSTLAEARFFARAGFRDITYAVPIATNRLHEAAELARSLGALNLLLDHEATLGAMESVARATGSRFRVFLKVDCGYHRAGVDPEREESVALALRIARSPHLDFRGLLTHAGHSYLCRTPEEVRVVAGQERSALSSFADKLRAHGVEPPELSVGSTPTISLGDSLDGVTEARPGNYVFYDRFQATLGSCTLDETAFSVLVTVLAHYPDRNELLVDAGALAFSRDEGPTHLDPDCGFGAVFSGDGESHFARLRVVNLSQEHGKLRGEEPLDPQRFGIGTKLRIVPNHSCLAAALFDRYHVLRGESVVDEWRPVRGW
ncbi:MAG TPA: alanine racemase [Vicinamibacteria bacterium]|nr:alanine racemase [Vicinamibacteria bacterium]